METSFYTDAAQAFVDGQTQLNMLEQELATGKAVSTASADPAAFTAAAADNDDLARLAVANGNQTVVQDDLGRGTSALNEATTVLDRIQQIALQAISGTANGSEYQALSEQAGQGLQQLLTVANTSGNDGNYVFAGTAAHTRPFVQTAGGGVEYVGDDGLSEVEVAPGVSINAALNGAPFLSGLSGDGYASVTAASGNAGVATLLPVGVQDAAGAEDFQRGSTPITVSFSSAASGKLTYSASEGGSVIASGSASPEQAIVLDGVQFELSGTPTAGDSFTISPARPQSVFTLVQTIQNTLASQGTTPAERAQTRQVLGNALAGVTQYQDLFTSANGRIGVVLHTVANANTANANESTNDQTDVADKTAANTPKVLTELDQQTAALEAALKAFSLAEGLSVFDYL